MVSCTIVIADIRLYVTVGVYESERTAPQELILHLTIQYTRPSVADDIATTCDYDQIMTRIEDYAATRQPNLIETVAYDVAELCLADERVDEVVVEVVKPQALQNGTVSTRVTRRR